MSQTFFRFGLWIILIVLALYVVRESVSNSGPDFVSDQLLQHAGAFGLLLLGAGVVSLILEKAASKARFRRCMLCRQPVAKGELYCRVHLRQVVEREHELNRRTRAR